MFVLPLGYGSQNVQLKDAVLAFFLCSRDLKTLESTSLPCCRQTFRSSGELVQMLQLCLDVSLGLLAFPQMQVTLLWHCRCSPWTVNNITVLLP